MPIGVPGGSGGGGGGLTLGPPTNTFTAATQALAEAARDTYAAANADWLAAYDDEPTYTIEINWPVAVTDTLYQSRRGGAWADVTGLIRGKKGAAGTDGDDGDEGAQGRFLVYAYVNSAVAPAAVPVGGTFTQSTGVLTVPVGYTAIPVTPVLTERTYRTQAVVNPATDADVVNLVWVLPSEAPEYDAAGLAEAAQEAAEAAQALAEQAAGQAVDIPTGSPRGALIATSPTLPTAATGTNTVISFGAALWTVEADVPDGFEAGPAANNERLYLPDIHPAGSNGIWLVVEVAGVELAEIFISHGGIQGATGADRRLILPVSVTADALIRTGFWPRSGATAAYIQLTGNSDTLSADTVVKIYLAVVRGEAGGGVPGGGGGLNQVSSDATLTGVGTAADPLMVASPFTAAEKAKLAGVGAGANANVGVEFTQAEKTKLAGIAVGATALTLNNVLAAILEGTGIAIDRAVAGQITISYDAGGSGNHTRRSAISEDNMLEAAEATAGLSSMTNMITLPTWGTGVLRHIFIGVPEAEDDISDIIYNGLSQFAGYDPFVDGSNDPIIIEGHKWWFTDAAQDGEFASGLELEIVQ